MSSSSRGDMIVNKNMDRGLRLSNTSEYRLWAEGEELCVTWAEVRWIDCNDLRQMVQCGSIFDSHPILANSSLFYIDSEFLTSFALLGG